MKILINNEEVVCSNKITIKEEMLNTSSTILNNCYPLSWEETKDYTQYYYPEDYSKCLIYNPQNIDYTIVGSLYQGGTPTPSNPIPIITKTGVITENINDKNYQFNLGNIELCEISPYQDKIAKSTGKNLLDKDNANIINGLLSDGGALGSNNSWRTLYIPCKPNTTYTVSKIAGRIFRVADFTNIPTFGEYWNNRIKNDTATSITYTTSSNGNYLVVNYYCSSYDTLTEDEILSTIQIELGSTATEFEPFGKVWYLHKEIGKVVLNGTENWQTQSTTDANHPRFRINDSSLNILSPSANNQAFVGKCSHFKVITAAGGTGTYNAIQGVSVDTSNNLAFYVNDISVLDDFKTWLSNNNVTVYYPLTIPTNTVITDVNLLKQLNAINNNLLFCGVAKRTGNINLNPRQFHGCDIQILDFKTFLSEGETLDFVINNKTILESW